MDATQPSPFLSLPAELRLHVYAHIIATTGTPTSSRLKQYRGLLLSCHDIYADFEHEAITTANRVLDDIQTEWSAHHRPLRLPVITKLSDTICPRIGMPAELNKSIQKPDAPRIKARSYELALSESHILSMLFKYLPSFRLYRWNNQSDEGKADGFLRTISKRPDDSLGLRCSNIHATIEGQEGGTSSSVLHGKVWIYDENADELSLKIYV